MVEETPLLQEREQPPHLRVREGNLAVVEVSAIAAGVGFRRSVRKMGIVEVSPQKKRLRGSLLQTAERLIHHQVATPLGEVEIGFVEPAEVEVIEVGFKPLIESESGVENGRADKGGRRVAAIAQALGQGRGVCRELVAAEIVHPRRHGEAARKDYGVRGQRDRHGSVSLREPGAKARQGVDVRRLNASVAVTPQVVRAQGVNGDEDDVGLRASSSRGSVLGEDAGYGGQQREPESPQLTTDN